VTNLVWSFAKLKWVPDRLLLNSLAKASLSNIHQFKTLELANSAWAFARLECLEKPVFDVVSGAALQVLEFEPAAVEMLLWSFSRLHDDFTLLPAFLQHLEDTGHQVSGLGIGSLLAACERQGYSSAREVRILGYLGQSHARACVTHWLATRMLAAGEMSEAISQLRSLLDDGDSNAITLRICRAIQLPGQDIDPQQPPMSWIPSSASHAKELRLLATVLSTAQAGNPSSVCAAIEKFGQELAPTAGQWLKIAGGAKATILCSALRLAPEDGAILEVGTYCGYSALRLAMAAPCSPILTLEVDAVHAFVAHNIIAFAGLTHAIEIRIGHSADVLPQLLPAPRMASRRPGGFRAVFMDQKGSRYGEDLQVLEAQGHLQPGATIIADNVLKPGSPAFLWRVARSGNDRYRTSIVHVPEFAMPGADDWMSVSVFLGPASNRESESATNADLPLEVRHLQWEADRMRTLAGDPRRGSVSFEDWAAFSMWMRSRLFAIGIQADAQVDAEEVRTFGKQFWELHGRNVP